MARPMTGQPEGEDEMAKATQRANKELTEDVPEDIKNDELTRESMKDNSDTEDAIETLRDECEKIENKLESEGKSINTGSNVNNEKEMHVTEDGETQTFTKSEWAELRGSQGRVWDGIKRRDATVYVKTAHWFTDADTNKVSVGDGFYGKVADETEKAYQFEVSADNGNHNGSTETFWVPKSACRVHKLN